MDINARPLKLSSKCGSTSDLFTTIGILLLFSLLGCFGRCCYYNCFLTLVNFEHDDTYVYVVCNEIGS